MISIQLQPVDTWFFRDGTPFTALAAPQEDVGSTFPPNPPTVVGALRTALALQSGWSGRGRWGEKIAAVLGDGPKDLGEIAFDGPFLLRRNEPLFPVPAHLLGDAEEGGWQPKTFLRPGPPVDCDLGTSVPLPMQVSHEKLKPASGQWLTRSGLNDVFSGRTPNANDVVSGETLWSTEPRIGLKRDYKARTAEEKMLYSTRHVRLAPGVALGVRIRGLPNGWAPYDRLVPFGGESRLAECLPWSEHKEMTFNGPWSEAAESPRANTEVALIALSPLDLHRSCYVGEEPLRDIGVRVVSACLGRPGRIGGWDSLARRPLPLRPVLPAGSVLFCKIEEMGRFNTAVANGNGLARIGSRQEWGFGLVAPGAWPKDGGDQ